MATTTPNLSLTVWNLGTDPYSHLDLENNWNLIDAFAGKAGKAIQVVSNLNAGTNGGPASPLNAGDLVTTNTTVNGFPAWTLLRYSGSTWEAVGPIEIQSSVPNSNLYIGRTVYLTSAASNFQANTLIVYNGTTWNYAGALQLAYTGSGALNINGVGINGDIYINSGSRGIILTDRTTTITYRVYMDNAQLKYEAVS